MNWYKSVVRPLLFTQNPEMIHDLTMHYASQLNQYPSLLKMLRPIIGGIPSSEPVNIWDIEFPNRVGLAAGFDKDGEAPWFWHMMGFGFIEIGAITECPQPGNPSPRVFRLIPDQAIINRMGFNNSGVEKVQAQLSTMLHSNGPFPFPVGVNIGKNKWVKNEESPQAYASVLNPLYDLCDFFVVNVSSPNTPHLRDLQDESSLRKIFNRLFEERQRKITTKPILLKLAPDLSGLQIEKVINLIDDMKIDGIIISNTTITRQELLSEPKLVNEKGGLSGLPVKQRSTELIRQFHTAIPHVPIIGVGGIFNSDDAKEKLEAGATLLQIYTGMVYEGPFIVRQILAGLKD